MSDVLRLLLVDEDPVFRLGLRIWLDQSPDFRVVGEADTAAAALDQISVEGWSETEGPVDEDQESAPVDLAVDLVMLNLGLGQGDPAQLSGLHLCREIKSHYPALPVLVLSAGAEPVLKAAAEQMGADGFGRRDMAVQDLARLIRRVAHREPPLPQPSPPAKPIGPLAALRNSLRQDALTQIQTVMAQVNAERQKRPSLWADAVLAGRHRELRAASWLVNRLLGPGETPKISVDPLSYSSYQLTADPVGVVSECRSAAAEGSDQAVMASQASLQGAALQSPSRLTLQSTSEYLSLQRGDIEGLVFETVFRQLQGRLDNISDVPLETDILREERKRELLYLTLRQLENALTELRHAQVQPSQLSDRALDVLQDVWQAVSTDFFGRYYTLKVDNLEQSVVKALLEEADVVRMSILEPIPLVPQLLGHLLFRESLPVDDSLYLATTPEALARSRALVEHLLIQLANAVMQPLLNRFPDVETLKKALYHRRMMSTRDIERFRNDLSWRYRWESLIHHPKAIFESQYRLFEFTPQGIQTRTVYAPRRDELEQLSQAQLSVTLALEVRDALSPRLRKAISFVGSGLVYLLTDLVGRGIGLVGRGIIKGIGSAWNDARFRRGSSDRF